MAASSTPKLLKSARQAVWKALREWPLWTAKIQTPYETDDEVRRFIQQDANVSRCPAMSVLWRTTNPEWWVHSQQEWKCPLEVSIWVPSDSLSLSEDLIEDAIDAVFRAETQASVAGGRVFVVQSECGNHPQILSMDFGVPVQAGENGQHRLLQSSVVFHLPLKKRPIMAPNS